MRVGGLFTGIGAHAECLKDIPDTEIVFQCENDERTAHAYDLMHGVTPNLGDVTKVANLDDCPVELLYVSPPCQDISRQGKRVGLEARKTRSGLIWEIPRIIGATSEELRPNIIIWEDVPDLVGRKFLPTWEAIEDEMTRIGYRTRWKLLNAYDFGIPQSRKRFYAISRRDLKAIEFPQRVPLFASVRDFLEDEVEERHYIKPERVASIIRLSGKEKLRGNGFSFRPTDADACAKTITTHEGMVKTSNYLVVERGIRVLGSLDLKGWNESIRRVYDPDRCAPTLTGSHTSHIAKFQLDETRVRRLTPRECFRLQGFSDESIDRISELSMTFQYRLAGNSICVAPLKAITLSALNPTYDQTALDQWS